MGAASGQGLGGPGTVWPGDRVALGIPQRCGFHWWELEHLGGDWMALGHDGPGGPSRIWVPPFVAGASGWDWVAPGDTEPSVTHLAWA